MAKLLTTQNPPARYVVGEPVFDKDGVAHTVTEIEKGRGGVYFLIHATDDFVRLVLPSEGIYVEI